MRRTSPAGAEVSLAWRGPPLRDPPNGGYRRPLRLTCAGCPALFLRQAGSRLDWLFTCASSPALFKTAKRHYNEGHRPLCRRATSWGGCTWAFSWARAREVSPLAGAIAGPWRRALVKPKFKLQARAACEATAPAPRRRTRDALPRSVKTHHAGLETFPATQAL